MGWARAAAAANLDMRASERDSPTSANDHYSAFPHQVGGHKQLSEEGGALVVPAPGLVAKPMGHGYWAGEDAFYDTLSSRADPLLSWCPTYYGTRVLSGRKHLLLEDLTHGMRRPCVVDIKLGTCTVASEAAWPKRVSHLLKDRHTTTRSLGLRIIGVRTPAAAAGGAAVVRDKSYGKRLRPEQMCDALRESFSADGALCAGAVREFVGRLERLLRLLSSAARWRLVSSSLLFVFDPSGAAPPQLRCIDFAHTYALRCAADHGYLYGLRNLIGLLGALLPAAASSSSAAPPPGARLAPSAAPLERLEAQLADGAGAPSEAEVVAAASVALHADELLEGLGHAELGGWVRAPSAVLPPAAPSRCLTPPPLH